jgi:dihydroxy-acid dehydratase
MRRTLPRFHDLNRYSRHITQPKSQGASQAMLWATDSVNSTADLSKGMVGVGSVWYEGNPCNKHTLGLGNRIAASIKKEKDLIAYQFSTIGVSDGISMGTSGMRYSLSSREVIADSVESIVEGCDKNMPGVLMALARTNRPSLVVYGGSIKAGTLQCSGFPEEPIDIVSAFQSYGEFLQSGETEQAEAKRQAIVKGAIGGCGACAGSVLFSFHDND